VGVVGGIAITRQGGTGRKVGGRDNKPGARSRAHDVDLIAVKPFPHKITLLYDQCDLCTRSGRLGRVVLYTVANIHVATSNIEFDASSMTVDNDAPGCPPQHFREATPSNFDHALLRNNGI